MYQVNTSKSRKKMKNKMEVPERRCREIDKKKITKICRDPNPQQFLIFFLWKIKIVVIERERRRDSSSSLVGSWKKWILALVVGDLYYNLHVSGMRLLWCFQFYVHVSLTWPVIDFILLLFLFLFFYFLFFIFYFLILKWLV